MLLTDIPKHIARLLAVRTAQVEAVIRLLDEGNTVPFIARYRKEATGELDEEAIRTVEENLAYLRNLVKRQEEILASIDAQGKLTDELAAAIQATGKLQELEDLYLPYRPKKRTRAQIARERGLEPLAERMLAQAPEDTEPLVLAAEYIQTETQITTPEEALAGAQDIIAEMVSDSADFRAAIRRRIWASGKIASELAVPLEEAKEVLTYQDYCEPISRMPSHRILAINRGENKDLLRISLLTDTDGNIAFLASKMITRPSAFQPYIEAAVADSYKRLLFPALEREIRNQLTENAEKQAIRVFGLNLRQLLLQPPLAGHTVMGLDPGYRTGCKLAVVSPTGTVLQTGTIYITMSDREKQKAAEYLLESIRKHNVSLISIGNGTASYETEEFVAALIQEHALTAAYLITNEAGASVYSASKLAKDELPELDVSIRGAVSIARRIQDPLAELVKIDPKSIGVGQYQHDVNQKELSGTLDTVVESAVNHVGVELNTASPALLQRVAGINTAVAKNIVNYRDQSGSFQNRKQLLKVPRLGPAAYTQCAGFLRLAGGDNPLDNTSIHPESYPLAEQILQRLGFALTALQDKSRQGAIQVAAQQTDSTELAAELAAGEPTVRDILAALSRPGRDPRADLPAPMTRKNVTHLSDMKAGTIVKGTVHNVTDFGVFVDIGIKVNGLIHRSQLSDKPFRHPLDIVSVGDIIDVLILTVEEDRGRIGLSLKQVPKNKNQ